MGIASKLCLRPIMIKNYSLYAHNYALYAQNFKILYFMFIFYGLKIISLNQQKYF